MSSTTVVRGAQALLTGLIDYAGIFPPAGLSLAEAVERYAERRRSAYGWMLGRFVLPLDHLDPFEEAAGPVLPRGEGDEPWRLSVLGSQNPGRDVAEIAAFNTRHARGAGEGAARIDVVELKSPRLAEIEHARPIRDAGLACFCEVPLDDKLPAFVDAVRAAGAGAKVRTGGVVSEAFPSSSALADFITTCAGAEVTIKASAGLHHAVRGVYPLTYEADSATAVAHGFLNVFLAAAYAWDATRRGADRSAIRPVVEQILDLDDPRLLTVDDQRLSWATTVTMRVDSIVAARERFAVSFGSCSVEEPIEELQALGWV